MTKGKSILFSIIVYVTYFASKNIFGPTITPYLMLLLALMVLYWKIRYNTIVGPEGWTPKIILFNSVTGLLLAFGIVFSWGSTYNVVFNPKFLEVVSQITIYGNLLLNGITFGWDALKKDTLDQLNQPTPKLPEQGSN